MYAFDLVCVDGKAGMEDLRVELIGRAAKLSVAVLDHKSIFRLPIGRVGRDIVYMLSRLALFEILLTADQAASLGIEVAETVELVFIRTDIGMLCGFVGKGLAHFV